MAEEKLITEFTAYFENRKANLSFNIQDGTAYIYLVADGQQIAFSAKLLVLKGKQKPFKVKIYEIDDSKQKANEIDPGTKTNIRRKSSDT